MNKPRIVLEDILGLSAIAVIVWAIFFAAYGDIWSML